MTLEPEEGVSTPPSYLYVFVRLDLPSKAQIAVQAIHAAVELGRKYDGLERAEDHPHLVLIGVKDARRMRKLIREDLEGSDLAWAGWREPDLHNHVTSVAVGPLTSLEDRERFAKWKTLDL